MVIFNNAQGHGRSVRGKSQVQRHQRAGAMRERTSNGNEHSKPPDTERLRDIWGKVLSDTDARTALERLDEAGFRISHLKPRDATFQYPNWADCVAALPFLPNKPSTRRIHRKTSFQKYWPLVGELRRFAAEVNVPFVEVATFGTRDYSVPAIGTLREDLLKAASMLEHFLSWDFYVRYLNSRNALIAELRWTIRERTGRPHDPEFGVLIHTAFRAAGFKEGCYIDSTALDRIEKRQREGRVKANRRMRRLISVASPSLCSTRIRPDSRKRV